MTKYGKSLKFLKFQKNEKEIAINTQKKFQI